MFDQYDYPIHGSLAIFGSSSVMKGPGNGKINWHHNNNITGFKKKFNGDNDG
ncbi:hypothetical protein [Acetobacterium woodii]|uniref:hypothetical protein n=1 Tax=Acetobacterium woodii TaxID=33952 RepID=UPI0002D3750F|nr:hypothetical protein [Acetobacterium woodii]